MKQGRAKSEAHGTKFKFDGRTIKPIEDENGKDIFKTYFIEESGRLIRDTQKISINKKEDFAVELRERGSMTVVEAAEYWGVTTVTIHNWMKPLKQSNQIKVDSPGPNRPSMIVWIGD